MQSIKGGIIFNRYNNLNNSIMITREMRFKKDFILEKIEEVKLNELRIGNFVYSLSDDDKTLEFVEISEIHDDMVYFKECNFDGTIGGSCYPIELTEEWLLKMGFKFDSIDWEFPNESIFFIGYYSSKFCLGSGSDGVTKENYIYYVHQLQNLYFALTGEELTIKK